MNITAITIQLEDKEALVRSQWPHFYPNFPIDSIDISVMQIHQMTIPLGNRPCLVKEVLVVVEYPETGS